MEENVQIQPAQRKSDRLGSRQLWDKYMSAYDYLTRVDSYSENVREIARASNVQAGMRVLDAGSGTGNLSMLLKAERCTVVSLDFSEAALRIHREKDPAADQVHASLEEPLPFADGSFDVVCCASVLFALSQEGCRLALAEFHRVLVDGGRLVVTVACPSKKNSNLLRRHLQSKMAVGRVSGVVSAIRELPSIMRVLYYNRLLQQQPDWKGYHRFSQEELRGAVSLADFAKIDISRTYGGSFFLACMQKPVSHTH